MIRILDASVDDVFSLLARRSVHRDEETERIVREILDDVRARGDAALLESARRFDAPGLASLAVTEEEIERAEAPERAVAAIRTARLRVHDFHGHQLGRLMDGWNAWPDVDDHVQDAGLGMVRRWQAAWGVAPLGGGFQRAGAPRLGQRMISVSSAGVYVPGGNATYPSSVIMNAVPAKVAGVEKVYVTTPTRRDGTLDPAVLVALREVGVTAAYKIGGAAAIAALAIGTETISKVDKIVGPGNRFVNEAKRQLWGQVGLDGYAGPSEVCVLADDTANPVFAAADLLTQIEHAPDNAGFLVTLSRGKMDEILAEVERQLHGAPREATMRAALANESLAVVAKDIEQAMDVVNAIAPEHLTLAVADPEAALEKVVNAGCILLGEYTPESAGDFCLGPSHTLPTSGAARWQSPVNVLDFLKVQSIARLSAADLQPLIPVVEAFGEMEGFPTHGSGATVRRT